MRATSRAKRRQEDPPTGDADAVGGPTQLRQQSYVGQRPGAYWAAPGAATVQTPSPATLPTPQRATAGDADLEQPAVRAPGDADPSSRQPLPPRDPEVLLEAEPVLSILVNATPMPEPEPEPPVQRRRLERRTIFILLAVVAVVFLAIAAGVIVGTSASRNSKTPAPTGGADALSEQSAPSRSPRSSPPPTATTAACASELASWNECLQDNNLDAQACDDCYSAWLDSVTDQTTCGEATSLICAQIQACTSSCGSCGSYIEEYEMCNYGSGCFLTCPYDPPPSAAPSVDPCQSETDAMSDCVRSSGVSIEACSTCIGEIRPETIDTCDESESYTCGAMEACPECGNCEEEYVAMTNCLNEGYCDPFACPASAPNATAPPPTTTPVSRPLR